MLKAQNYAKSLSKAQRILKSKTAKSSNLNLNAETMLKACASLEFL